MSSKFEDIVRKKFEGASSPVPPSAWAEVSSGMAGGAASSVFSSVVAKLVIAAVISGAVITTVVLTQAEDAKLPEETTSVITPLESKEDLSIREEDTPVAILARDPIEQGRMTILSGTEEPLAIGAK